MRNRTFVIVSVSSRVDDLNALIRSIRRYSKFDSFDICCLFQDPDGVAGQIEDQDQFATLIVKPELMGCHAARVHLLRKIRYRQYVNLDDDMELVDETDYEMALAKVNGRRTGFVLTNWARNRKLLNQKIPKMSPTFQRQVLVYQGGGMCYRDEIADLMRELPEIDQTFDHSWPLTAYVNGFRNYRYLGSLAIHRVCTSGGMKDYLGANPPATLMEEFVSIKRAKRQDGTGRSLKIPLDPDLKPAAHAAHRAAAERFVK